MGLSVTANAATYSDEADISKDEAVAVMSGIKVFDGIDGAFQPTGTLTREMGAKIIASMIIGRTAADALATQATVFADVAADRWSAGSIAFCTSEGIIGGVGDNKFDPAGSLTGYAFAKMALVALGYDPQVEGLVGANWQINTAKLALSAGLTDNLDEVVMSQPLTREQAAQMALNTEEATMVEYTGGVTIGDVKVGSTRSEVKHTSGKDYRDNANENAATGTLQFCERYASKLTLTTTVGDDFGRPSNKWMLGAETLSNEDSKTPVVSYTAVKSTTQSTNRSLVAKDLDGYTISTNVPYTLNGTAQTALTITNEIADLLEQGRQVEVYATGTVLSKVVVIDTYIAQVSAKDTSNKTVSLTVYNGAASNTTRITSSTTDTNADFYEKLYALDKGDYVLLNASNIAAGSLAILDVVSTSPTTVSGKYTAAASGKLTIDGTAYPQSHTQKATAVTTLGNSYSVKLDQLGNIIWSSAVTDSTTYAYVLATDKSGSVKDSNVQYYAQLLFTDGTIEWVELSNIANSTATTISTNYTTLAGAVSDATGQKFVSYTKLDDGTYKVSAAVAFSAGTENAGTIVAYKDNGDTGTGDAANVVVKKNTTALTGDATNVTVNNSTVFLFKNSDSTYTAYTGLSTLPSSTTLAKAYLLIATDGTQDQGVAKIIVAASMAASASTDYVYVYGTSNSGTSVGKDANGASVSLKTLKTITNGTVGTTLVKQGVMGTTTASTQGMYTGENGHATNVAYKGVTYVNDYIDTTGAVNTTETTALSTGGNITTTHNGGGNKGSKALYIRDLDEYAGKIWEDNGVLKLVDDDETVSVLVGTAYKVYVVNKAAGSYVEFNVPTTDPARSNYYTGTAKKAYFVVDENGYLEWMVIESNAALATPTTIDSTTYANSSTGDSALQTALDSGVFADDQSGTTGHAEFSKVFPRDLSYSVDGGTIYISGTIGSRYVFTASDGGNGDGAAAKYAGAGNTIAELLALNRDADADIGGNFTKVAFIPVIIGDKWDVVLVGYCNGSTLFSYDPVEAAGTSTKADTDGVKTIRGTLLGTYTNLTIDVSGLTWGA